MNEVNWSNDVSSDMFFIDFESLFSTADLKGFPHLVVDKIKKLVR